MMEGGWMNEWMDGCINRWMGRWVDEWVNDYEQMSHILGYQKQQIGFPNR